MNNFVHEDGERNLYDDPGMSVKVVEMEVDEEMFPIETVTNFDIYIDLKPPEKKTTNQSRDREAKSEEDTRASVVRKHYKDAKKEQLFALIYEKGMSARAAALKLQINPRTAQRWVANDQENPQAFITRKEGSGWPVGRPALLDDSHKKFLVDLVDSQPSLVLDQMMDSLTTAFIDLEISKTTLHNFVTKNCKISLKRAHFHLADRI